MMKRSIGIALLLAVFSALFISLAVTHGGLINAAVILGLTAVVTAIIAGALWLIVSA